MAVDKSGVVTNKGWEVKNTMYPTIEDFAEQALVKPENFMSLRDPDFDRTMGRTIAHTRDSDILEESNWEVITKDMQERFPDDCSIESENHWAVGWIETLFVRVYATDDSFTRAFRAIYEWGEQLSDYPVADEVEYSRMEWEDFNTTLTNCYGVSEDVLDQVASHIYDDFSVCRGDDLTQEMVDSALAAT
jgi:hypothetical protein